MGRCSMVPMKTLSREVLKRRRWRKRPAFVYFFASGEAALAVFVLVQETQQTSDVYLSLVDPLPNLDPVPSLVKQEDLCSLEVYRDQSRITSCAHPYLEASCLVLYPCCTRRGTFQKTMKHGNDIRSKSFEMY